jgi:hypothetical protein
MVADGNILVYDLDTMIDNYIRESSGRENVMMPELNRVHYSTFEREFPTSVPKKQHEIDQINQQQQSRMMSESGVSQSQTTSQKKSHKKKRDRKKKKSKLV